MPKSHAFVELITSSIELHDAEFAGAAGMATTIPARRNVIAAERRQ